MRGSSQRVIRLGAGPIFTARWLMPRISEFWERHPDLTLEVVPSLRPSDLSQHTIDLVVRWERLQEMPEDAIRLLVLQPVAVASPDFVARFGPFCEPADLLTVPILHQSNHWGWSDWFNSQGITPPQPIRGSVVNDANILIRAAADGQGAIIGWLPLISQDLGEGRVVRLFDEKSTPTHGYVLDLPDGNPTRRETQKALDWLTSYAMRGGDTGTA